MHMIEATDRCAGMTEMYIRVALAFGIGIGIGSGRVGVI